MEHTTTPSAATARIRRWLARETTSGVLLLAAAAIALVWANSPAREGYFALADTHIGPESLHLNLTLAHWAADGLLAVFFFVVGVELKQEFVAGSLRRPREAAVPIVAAVGGMAVPAVIFTAVVLAGGDASALSGWAIPTATDIAFALAVLAIFGRGLPTALRMFLLTLAVVDDLLASIVIAVVYTTDVDAVALAGAFGAIAVFAFVVRRRRAPWLLLGAIGLVAWAFMHASGIHATVAGVVLGFTVPATAIHGEHRSRTTAYEHAVRPWSTAIALPVFAFFSAGVSVADGGGFAEVLGQPVVLAIVAGLVAGKLIGVLGTTALVTRLTPLRLPDSIGLRDLLPVGFLTGIGFTVSLLIAELSFPAGTHTDGAKLGVLTASLIAAVLGAILLRWDAHKARGSDMNEDGVPDAATGSIGDEGP